MTFFKQDKIENFLFALLILFVVVHALFRHDSIQALISAVCGITYSFYAGKGKPVCYLFGVTGSTFYGYLSFCNALWGNLILYVGYYIPMQIIGYFKWNENLKVDKKEIVKTSLSKRDFSCLVLINLILVFCLFLILRYFNDLHPILDSVTTIFSITGMVLTVKRCIEQWLFWTAVNGLALIMWLNIALGGARVWSTVLMWAVYLFLSIYFYIQWKREMSKPNMNN